MNVMETGPARAGLPSGDCPRLQDLQVTEPDNPA